MRRSTTWIPLAALTFAGSACGGPSEPAADTADQAAVTAADPAPVASNRPPASFAACQACHSITPGEHKIGPSLAGVNGKKAGSALGFVYSQASQTSGATWDDATLDAYLAAPTKFMPGTKMSFAGVSDPAKRKELIEYLKTLK